ncbi:MAG: DUF72 domain-containing protein [Myxococcales bacterium]|nr:DUF72 domain-containing protein [Polyangiaceae bacterium]MDW8250113.1 DUF72 domain-containing protein [Myxococcales bacterium]
MTTVHVGLPSHLGSLARYASHFDLVEVRPVATSIPKPTKLRQWRKQVPPTFVFSVVLPPVLTELRAPSLEQNQALKITLDAAEALEARCLVLQTPPSVTPTVLYKKRLAALLEQLPRDVVLVGWEPRGIWSPGEMDRWSRDLGVHLIDDVSQREAPRGATLYTRLRGIGSNARVSMGVIERIRTAFVDRREVFVVIEADGPKRIADALRRPLEGGERPAMPTILRPQVRADDEEQ